jgi:hypothetical protein
MADKQPKGQRVPGTDTYHVDEPTKNTKKPKRVAPPPPPASGPTGEKVPGSTNTYNVDEPTKPFAKGGSVTRGDGCAQRGKTKGKMR